MGKKRVYEFAKEMHVDNKDVLDIAKNLGIEVKNHMSSIDQDQEAKIKGVLGKSAAAKAPATSAAAKPAKSKAATAKDHAQSQSEKPVKHENKPAKSNKTADGKIILSKSTILRPRGTQTAHKAGNHSNQQTANANAGNRNNNRGNNNNRSANNNSNRSNDRNRRKWWQVC